MPQDIICDINILSRISDFFFKMEDLIRLHKRINNHVVDGSAHSMRVALFEQLIASLENLLDLIEKLLIVAHMIPYDSGARYEPLMIKTH